MIAGRRSGPAVVRRRAAAVIAALAAAVPLTVVPADASSATAVVGATTFVASTVGGAPSARSLDAALPPDIRVAAVRPLGAGLARITVRGAVAGDAAEQVGDALAATPRIAAAAPAFRTRITGAAAPVTTRDQVFPDQWDLWDSASVTRAGGYGIDAPRAWQRTLGSASVVVAVLDTGITAQRDLLGIHRVPGYDFVSGGDGVGTGDGNGWDADPSDPGDACTAEQPASPSSWHGTFVTGEIAATHDGWGVAGEAPGVAIEPVRVLGACGGSEADLIAGIEWAAGVPVAGVPVNAAPARVLSISLGAAAPTGCDGPLQHALDAARARGATVVVAAGNDDAPMVRTAPADCRGVVSVAASTRYGNRSDYSNFGADGMSPTLAAPGGNEANPVWGDTWSSTGAIDQAGNRSEIAGYLGTSMATPRVSAAVALLLSTRPTLSPDAVLTRLTSSVTPFPAGSTCTVARCGAGVLDVGDLVGAPKRLVHAARAVIGGIPRAGHLLTAHAGTFRPGATHLAYRWYRNGKPLAATGAHYRVRAADRGALLTLRVTGSRPGYVPLTERSAGRRVAR